MDIDSLHTFTPMDITTRSRNTRPEPKLPALSKENPIWGVRSLAHLVSGNNYFVMR
jgi:hypothetical protein